MTLASYRTRYPHARKTTLQRLEKQEAVTAELERFVKSRRRQTRLERIKRVFLWPAVVWRW